MTDRAQILAEVATRVLEDAAFLFVTPSSGEPACRLELQASVHFKLPRSGWLKLAASEPLAREIASNMLGLERDDPAAAASAGDGLGELANVLAGALLAELFGTGEPMSIGIPSVGPAEAAGEPAPGEVRAGLESEGTGSLMLSLALDAQES